MCSENFVPLRAPEQTLHNAQPGIFLDMQKNDPHNYPKGFVCKENMPDFFATGFFATVFIAKNLAFGIIYREKRCCLGFTVAHSG